MKCEPTDTIQDVKGKFEDKTGIAGNVEIPGTNTIPESFDKVSVEQTLPSDDRVDSVFSGDRGFFAV